MPCSYAYGKIKSQQSADLKNTLFSWLAESFAFWIAKQNKQHTFIVFLNAAFF
jgi:hypothetical protein